jgi:hypothetical protein
MLPLIKRASQDVSAAKGALNAIASNGAASAVDVKGNELCIEIPIEIVFRLRKGWIKARLLAGIA